MKTLRQRIRVTALAGASKSSSSASMAATRIDEMVFVFEVHRMAKRHLRRSMFPGRLEVIRVFDELKLQRCSLIRVCGGRPVVSRVRCPDFIESTVLLLLTTTSSVSILKSDSNSRSGSSSSGCGAGAGSRCKLLSRDRFQDRSRGKLSTTGVGWAQSAALGGQECP